VLPVPAKRPLDCSRRTVDQKQAAALEKLTDKRGSDAGAASDLEQAIARVDRKHLNIPANSLWDDVFHENSRMPFLSTAAATWPARRDR
jgi:hypothetical protein